MKLTSSAFPDNGHIPKLYTCDGDGVSVPLAWSGAPKGTAWFALTAIDTSGNVLHWYVVDIPAATTGIKQGAGYSAPGRQVSSWLACARKAARTRTSSPCTRCRLRTSRRGRPPASPKMRTASRPTRSASGQITGYYAD